MTPRRARFLKVAWLLAGAAVFAAGGFLLGFRREFSAGLTLGLIGVVHTIIGLRWLEPWLDRRILQGKRHNHDA